MSDPRSGRARRDAIQHALQVLLEERLGGPGSSGIGPPELGPRIEAALRASRQGEVQPSSQDSLQGSLQDSLQSPLRSPPPSSTPRAALTPAHARRGRARHLPRRWWVLAPLLLIAAMGLVLLWLFADSAPARFIYTLF
jgi:hypothetical protein